MEASKTSRQHRRVSNHGQVLFIFVFAIIGLVGITGLAVDGGNIYSDRRHAQNAADTAALTGAVVKLNQQKNGATGCTDLLTPTACGALVKNAALDMALQNGYDSNIVDSTVEVHIPPIEGPYADCGATGFNCNDYIQVIIDTNVNTYFARVLGVPQLHNHVQAVARAEYSPPDSLFGGNTLVSLKPTSSSCSGDFALGGSGSVTLVEGGIFVNSDNPTCAFKETSSCVTLTFEDGDGNVISGQIEGVPGSGAFTSSCPNAPSMTHDTEPVSFPPEPLFDEPEECGQTPAPSTTDGDGYTHLYPGHYATLPPARNTRLDPGVYCVDNVVKTVNPNSQFEGDGVMLYIKNGGAFSFQGGQVNLSASTEDPYKGYLIYVVSDYTGTPANCTINGNALSTFSGAIYAPYCDITINGTSGPTGYMAQIIGYTITLNGDTTLYFTYNADDMPTTPEINKTGLYH